MMLGNLRLWFKVSIAIVFMQSCILLAIILLDTDNALENVFAVMFWIGAVIYIASVILSCKERQKIEENRFRVKRIKKKHIGAFKFFQIKEAVIFDIFLLVLTALLIVLLLLKLKYMWLHTLVFILWFISLNLHCLLNGKNYIYIRTYEIYKKGARKKCTKKV